MLNQITQLNNFLKTILIGLIEKDNQESEKYVDQLVVLGLDDLCDGFFIYDIENNKEYYSPKFRHVLGFENKEDFPDSPLSWQLQLSPEDTGRAMEMFNNHIKSVGKDPYALEVTYSKKDGTPIKIWCEGAVIKWDKTRPLLMMGTHKKVE